MNKTETEVTAQEKAMIKEFQCSGCVSGMDTKCGAFKLWRLGEDFGCQSQVAGTRVMPGGLIALGLPRGFNKLGQAEGQGGIYIRLRTGHGDEKWDRLNVAVWAMEQEGYLFVRTYSPRINKAYVDVIKGGTLSQVPGAINVGEFKDDID